MADEPERRIIGALLAELEEQARGSFTLNIDPVDTRGRVQLAGRVDLNRLAKAVLAEMEPPKKPRLIEYDLPVRQTADLADEVLDSLWEVPMQPRNLPNAEVVKVRVTANSREEAISKALSAKPGHSWGEAVEIGYRMP